MTEHEAAWNERLKAAAIMAHDHIEHRAGAEDHEAEWLLLHLRAALLGARGDMTEAEWTAFIRAWEMEMRAEPPPLPAMHPAVHYPAKRVRQEARRRLRRLVRREGER